MPVVYRVFGVLSILTGLSLPLCGLTVDSEFQKTAPVRFWIGIIIPVLLGIFLFAFGVYLETKTPEQDHVIDAKNEDGHEPEGG